MPTCRPALKHMLAHTVSMPTHLALDELTNYLVIEVVNGRPFDAFLDVLLLFRLQSQLYKDLLKLLVHKVDAELLETIFLSKQKEKQKEIVLLHYIQ